MIGFMRSKGAFKSCQEIGTDDHFPPLHDDDVLSSRTNLFQEGGSDTGRPTVVSKSYTSSKPSYYKVNSIPYVTCLLGLRNGLLLVTPLYIHDRSPSTITKVKEARGLKPDKSHAWKRRRK